MPEFSLPPLSSAAELPALLTLNSLGEIELDFAIRELGASDEQPPLRALEVIGRHPAAASKAILQHLSDRLIDCLRVQDVFPRALANCLIVVASLQNPQSSVALLELIAEDDDIGELLLESLWDLLPRTLAATIPDLTTWRELADDFGSIPYEALIEALPFLVYWNSLSRSDAARQLIEHLDEFVDDDVKAFLAPAVVDALMCLAVPETQSTTHLINESAEPDHHRDPELIDAVFADTDAAVTAATALLNSQRLTDPVVSFREGEVFPPPDATPEDIFEALRLLDRNWSDFSKLLPAFRRLLREPDTARKVLLDYVRKHLRFESVSENRVQWLGRGKNPGPAFAVRLLLELRCPEILPLLLAAFEKTSYHCLDCFKGGVEPELGSLAAMTAPNPEFLVEWIRRLESCEEIACILTSSLAWIVLEERADRLQCITLLRELFVDWVNRPAAAEWGRRAYTASVSLLTLGDIDFFGNLLSQREAVPEKVVSLLIPPNLTAQTIPEELQKRCLHAAQIWFLSCRFMSASDEEGEELVRKYVRDLESDDGDEDFDEAANGILPPSFSVEGQLPSAKLDTQLVYSEINFDDPDDAPKTIRNTGKIGRNEPCPCGSGRKYKKCCGS